MSVQYFHGLCYFARISRSGFNVLSFTIYTLPHHLYQLTLSPHFIRQDTDSVSVIAIMCPFHGGAHHSHRRGSRIQYAVTVPVYLSSIPQR